MAMKDLLRIADLSGDDLEHLLDLSERIHADPHSDHGLLDGETVITYFAKPSTRTRLSFGSAINHLGGAPAVVGPNELQLGRGETIEDTAQVVSRYAAAFVIRTFADDDVQRFAAAATIPVINALTDLHHPMQALADLLTLRQRFGHLKGLRVAYLGDGNNVAHSLMEACAIAGIDIIVATIPSSRPLALTRCTPTCGSPWATVTTRRRRGPRRSPRTRSTPRSWPRRPTTRSSCTAYLRIAARRSPRRSSTARIPS